MPLVILFSRLVLSAVFLLAGICKLRERPGSLQSLLDFGLPRSLATPGAVLLSLAEILVLPASFAWIAWIVAIAVTPA